MKQPRGILGKASPADIPHLIALIAEFYAEADFPLNRVRAAETFAALLADERLGQVWLIQADAQREPGDSSLSSRRGNEAQAYSTDPAPTGDQSLLTSAATNYGSRSQPVGHLVVTLCFSMEHGGLVAFVDDLFVRRPFRRAGLGAAALQEARVTCVSRGVRAMLVETGHDNLAAQAVYRRAGFVPTDRLHLTLPLADPTHVG